MPTSKLTLILACFTLISCQTSNSKRPPKEVQTQARAQVLAETGSSIPKVQSPLYPSGKKRLLEPDILSIPAVPCAENLFSLNELTVKNFGLSNRDMASAVMLLETMGYNTIAHSDVMTNVQGGLENKPIHMKKYSCSELPLVLVPRPDEERNLIIGGTGDAPARSRENRNQNGVGNLEILPLRKAHAVDLDQLIVFYHDSQSVQMERFSELLGSVVDTASPQVYIETMVLEVSEEDSKELGVAYQTANIGSNSLLQLGSLAVDDGPTVDFERNNRRDSDGNFEFNPGIGIQAQVKALVDSGKAEILARPSVLALSNRQAVIQIVDVIQSPIVESSIGTTGELVVSAYSFEPLLLGITLNLRPRVSADREWVSLEIDATVEAEVDENSGEVFAPDGEGGRIILAEKKGSAARKVQTFARIPDRTPIIIGGLVAGNSEQQKSRVPVLGSIPFFGGLFGATDNEAQKREIVIVLTPHVLAEDAIGVRANMASDGVMSRQSDLSLFNNVYRVSESDVFDMNFLLNDQRFANYRATAIELLEQSPELIENETIRLFNTDRIPGDEVLVRKMVFDVVSANLARTFPDLKQLFLPVAGSQGNSELVSLAEVTRKLKAEEGDEVLVLEWFESTNGQPTFESHMVPAASAHSFQGSNAIILRSERDLQRLTAAIATEIVIDRNGGYEALNVATLKSGLFLSLADVDDYLGFRFTDETARIYMDSNHALRSLRAELDKAYREIDEMRQLKMGSDGRI